MNIRIVAVNLCLAVLLSASGSRAAIYTPGGPVYVNPEQEIQATPSQQTINYVTQTVYGFLDFTTTIGNTVMLFSPQSSAPAVAPSSVVEVKTTKVQEVTPSKVEEVTSSTVQAVTPSVVEVKPVKMEEKKPVVVTKEIKSVVSSIVNVITAVEQPEKPSIVSVVNVVKPETVATTSKTTQIVSTKVDVIVNKETHTVVPTVVRDPPEEVEQQIEEEEEEEEEEEVEEKDPQDGLIIESSIPEINSNVNSDIPVQIPNNIGEPEYDFLSRQPAEYVEETYRVHNLRGGGKPHIKSRPTEAPRRDSLHPTGLVTKLGGTVVKDGVTTIHETSVIGTYISGKYAQVLQSTSQIFHNPNKAKIAPSPSLKVLKTAAPVAHKAHRHTVEATPSLDSYEDTYTTAPGRLSKRPVAIPPTSPGDFKSRFRNRKYTPDSGQDYVEEVTPAAEKVTTKKYRNNHQKYNRPSSEVNTVSVYPETSSVPAFRRNKASRHEFKPTSTVTQNNEAHSRRGFKPKLHPTSVDNDQTSTSLYKFKLNRTPGRWQYKTTPKPRVNIRKSTDELKETATEAINGEVRGDDGDLDGQPSLTGDILQDDGRNGIEKPLPVETLKVEISTPADFADVYYEIATIKSPYTFQVGPVKKTRFITVTSTFEKTLEPETTTEITGPLTENILATTSHLDSEHNLLDSTIATLPPLYLSEGGETPSLETLTETFSTSHVLLKTHILPIVHNENSTERHTLIQTYHVTRLVTATKTLPPMESYHFVPSKTFNEFNSRLDEAGSELHLELEFGDNNEEDDDDEGLRQELPAELDLSKVGTDLDLLGLDRVPALKPKQPKITKTSVEVTTPKATEIQPEIQQLLRLLNPAAAANLPQVITSSKPVIKVETVYDSHVIPIFNGMSTIFSTLTRPIGTVTKTDYEYETTTIQPTLPIQPVPMNPLFPPQPQFQVTSAPIVTNTVVTVTDSKILKLTFGAKTAYTTLFSTHVTPTLVTTFVTQSVPVAPNAGAFPGYFPAPYAPFPYVG
ncbi:uncharacterized protein LOC132256494 [Phlebotomus argentipes]|uniref:uncharacterized protein LOC132256494 n=1 Tax=Phlebotomus argentipes TaxID=94469 RepID=UPI002892FBCD|nr:uncharacterized protein LOC132256494 [Phlebotomus argentipes]